MTLIPKCLNFATCTKDLLAIIRNVFVLHSGEETET